MSEDEDRRALITSSVGRSEYGAPGERDGMKEIESPYAFSALFSLEVLFEVGSPVFHLFSGYTEVG